MAPKTKGTKRSAGAGAPARSPKKAKPSPESDANPNLSMLAAVREAIGMAVGLPEGCRTMLDEALPHALGVLKAERTAPQTQMVEMIEEAIAGVDADLEKAVGTAAAELQDVHGSKDQLQVNKDNAQAALTEAESVVASRSEMLATAEKELKTAKTAATETADAHKATEKDFEKATKDKETYDALIVTELATLRDGTWEKKPDATKMCKHLEKLAAPLNLESSLTTALHGVFTKKPEERGSFEKIVTETLETKLREHVEKLSKMVAEWPATVTERAAAAEAATKSFDAATETKNAAQTALSEAKQGKTTAAKQLKDAEHKITNYMPALEAAAKKKDAADAQLKLFRSHNQPAFTTLRDKTADAPEEAAVEVAEEAAEVVVEEAVEEVAEEVAVEPC